MACRKGFIGHLLAKEARWNEAMPNPLWRRFEWYLGVDDATNRRSHPWMRSAICCVIDAQIPLESTPKWIWHRFVPSRFLGQEVSNEAFATSHRQLHRAATQFGIQAVRYGR